MPPSTASDRTGRPEPGLDAKVRFLRSRKAHGGRDDVEAIETHMSWVFIADDDVLKLKKPVRFPYLDFSTLAAREHDCREEVRLNERLAPGIYRGVVALLATRHGLALARDGPGRGTTIVDWLVNMRALPRERMLDRRIAAGTVGEAEIDAVGAVLARFYGRAPTVATDPAADAQRWRLAHAAHREILLRPAFGLADAAPLLDRLERAHASCSQRLVERRASGHVVEGHGDLRPEHVCLLDPPVVIDCLEFDASLRAVDPFDEIALLGFECELLGAAWIGPRLRTRLEAELDDRPGDALYRLYVAERAVLRARLAVAHLLDPAPRTPERWVPLARRGLALARDALDALDALEGGDRYSTG